MGRVERNGRRERRERTASARTTGSDRVTARRHTGCVGSGVGCEGSDSSSQRNMNSNPIAQNMRERERERQEGSYLVFATQNSRSFVVPSDPGAAGAMVAIFSSKKGRMEGKRGGPVQNFDRLGTRNLDILEAEEQDVPCRVSGAVSTPARPSRNTYL